MELDKNDYSLPAKKPLSLERIKLHLAQGLPPLLPEQVGHLLHHIYTLSMDKKSRFSGGKGVIRYLQDKAALLPHIPS